MTEQQKKELIRAFNAYADATARLHREWTKAEEKEKDRLFQDEYPFELDFETIVACVDGWRSKSISLLNGEVKKESEPMKYTERNMTWEEKIRAAMNIPITDLATATTFLKTCIIDDDYGLGLGLGFHPDTDFNDYIDHTGKPIFNTYVVASFNNQMCDCFDKVNQSGNDIYAIGISIWKELKLIPS